MTHQHLIRQIKRTPDESQVDPWDDPRWDEFRFTIKGEAMDISQQDSQSHLVVTDYEVFWRCLQHLRHQLLSPVRVMRVYQFLPAGSQGDDCQVFFVASFLYAKADQHVCFELRHACGSQDLDQDSASHLASLHAGAIRQALESGCQLLGIEVVEGLFVEEQS